MKEKRKVILPILFAVILAIGIVWSGQSDKGDATEFTSVSQTAQSIEINTPDGTIDTDAIPAYTGVPYVILNDNIPGFIAEDLAETESFEYYGKLDSLGRCTACYASIGQDLMPTEKRGNISSVKPTGWHSTNYSIVDGGSLYNRCHLIGYQLTAENANARNLITGTRYMNTQGMLPFEEETAAYIRSTGNHVLYRVTPIFRGKELVVRGVQMEAFSIEDEGEGVCFNVFCYNVQPGIEIDYQSGDSRLADEEPTSQNTQTVGKYILNTKSKKFHAPDCKAMDTIQENNKQEYEGSRDVLINEGYSPCGQCQP